MGLDDGVKRPLKNSVVRRSASHSRRVSWPPSIAVTTRRVVPRFFSGLLNPLGFEVVAATVEQVERTIRLTVLPRHPFAVCPHRGGLCGEVHQTRDLDGVRDLYFARSHVRRKANGNK